MADPENGGWTKKSEQAFRLILDEEEEEEDNDNDDDDDDDGHDCRMGSVFLINS